MTPGRAGGDDEGGEALKALVPSFKMCALQALRSVVRMPVVAGSGWMVWPTFNASVETGAAVGFAGNQWRCQCVVATEDRLRKLLRPDLDLELWIDALGEVANTICGLLQSRDDFHAVFGAMLQSPPVGMMEGRIRIQGWTVSGPLTTHPHGDVQFAFGARRVDNIRQG
ncbi:MAG: hypothetical protein IPN71_13150 [Fibrobacteres bacterium]|jgi:hypothetical protein|nr:hypothetical protein [Fibrobacterota bacterium]